MMAWWNESGCAAGRWMTVLLLGCTIVAPTQRVMAQLPFTSAADSMAYAAAHVTADTGRMVPAYRDLSRYNTPALCVSAIEGETALRWRRHERDTVEQTSPVDTFPTVAMTAGRACAAQFHDLAAVPARQLYSLMKLYIMLRDSANVWAVVNRRVALAPTVVAKGEVLASAVKELRNAQPMQLGQAAVFLARLDSLGHAARVPRLLATTEMFSGVSTLFDTTAMKQYAARLDAIGAELTTAERDNYGAMDGWEVPMDVAWYRHDPALPSVVQSVFSRLRTAMATYRGGSSPMSQGFEDFVLALAQKVGQPADSVKGKYWFNAETPARPIPGRVTLVVLTQKGGGVLSSNLAALRRLAKKYGPQGLDVTLVVKTAGYSWSSPPQTPEAEANTDAWYFLNYLKMPVALVVDETPFTRDDTERLQPGMVDFQKHYPIGWGLIGRDGKIRSLSVGYASDPMLEKFVQKALAE